MTEKQMISTLKELTFGTVVGSKGVEALKMAIKVLSQQPCADAVSREAVIEVIYDSKPSFTNDFAQGFFADKIRDLLSVTPQKPKYCDRNICLKNEYNGIGCDECEVTKSQEPCDDVISREFMELVVEYPPADLCAYPEYKGKPYYSIKYYENGEEFIGYGTYKPEVLSQYLKEYFIPSVTQKSGKCKNCKYFEYDSVAKVDGIPLIVAHEICNKWGNGCKTSEDGYCYLFEPMESEDKE